ncbi:hypothetical protein LWS69_14230, partial [Bordetella hinzii]|nr:hypothetical protein [Bordetella hinzii]
PPPPPYGWGWGWYDPVWAGVAVGVTAAAIGSMVASLPPDCRGETINGVNYQHCGDTWYEPVYAGASVQFRVVAPPY